MAKITLELDVNAEKGTATLKQFAGDAEQATKKAGDAAKEGGKGFGAFASSLDSTAAQLTALLTPTNLLGAGIGVGLVESLRRAQEATIEYASELTRLKGVTGASIEELGGLREAADKMGVGSDKLQRALLLMSTQIEAGGEALGRMGISVEDTNGKQKQELTLLFEVIDSLSGMTNKTQAAALAKKTFGRAVGELLPLLTAGSARIKELGESGAEFAKEVGDDALVKIREFRGELTETGDAVTRMQITVTRDAIPILSVLAKTFTTVVDAARQVPPEIRYIVEIVTILGAGLVSLALVVKTVGLAVGLLAGLPGIAGALAWIAEMAALAVAALMGLPAALAALILTAVVSFLFDIGGIRTAAENLASTLTTWLTNQIRPIAGLPPIELTVKPHGADTWEEYFSHIGTLWQNLKETLTGQPLTPALNYPTDQSNISKPRIGWQNIEGFGHEQEAMEQNLALKRKRLEIDKEILAETLKYYSATQAPEQAQISAIKENLALKLRELEIKKEERKDLAGLYDKEATEAKRAAAAQTLAIEVTSLKAIDAARAESLKVTITANETGEAKIRDLAKAETAEIDRQLSIQRQSRTLSQKEIIDAEEKKLQITVRMQEELRKLALEQSAQIMAIENKLTETVVSAREHERDATLATLTAEQVDRQHALDTFTVSQEQFTAESIQNVEKERQARLDALDVSAAAAELQANRAIAQAEKEAAGIVGSEQALAIKRADIGADLQKKLEALGAEGVKVEQESTAKIVAFKLDAAKLQESIAIEAENRDFARKIADLENARAAAAGHADALRVIDAKLFAERQGLFDRDVKNAIDAWAEETKLYQSEADKQLAIEAGKFTKEKALYDASIQNYINARLKETGYLQDALTKRLAEEAGYIQTVEQLRQQALNNAATVLEQEARQQGDLNSAFEVGFAHAASSAVDALKRMAEAGTQTYHDLESGASDFLYEILSTSGKIGDVFLNLGKKILRTMTDAFAEIAVKWAMTAAGFSLPTLLGTGTAIAGAAVGFEGAPNQAATAVKALGETAQTANVALGGMAQVSGVVTGVFGSLGSLLLTLGSVIFGVIKLLASIMTAGGLGGGIGAAGSSFLSNLGSLGSAFSTFTNLITEKLSTTIQDIFNAFSPEGSSIFSAGLGSVNAPGVAAKLLGDAIPIAGGLIQMALAGINGNIGGLVGGGIGGAIGAFFGGAPGFAIGEMIGNFIGSLIGGFFKGPTPEISGMVRLNSTTLAELQSAQNSGVFSRPGQDNFSFSSSGPLYEEMYKHRTEGNLNREDTQLLIMNVILKTLQEAFAGLDRLSLTLPTDLKSKLSDRINAVLAAGFQITDFKLKDSDVGDMLASFKTWLTGLSGNVLQTVVTQVFGHIDLSALGAGDAAKGFDALMTAMSAMGAVFKALDGQVDTSKITIEEFASGSVAFFQKFAKEGEAFTDTVQRITQSLGGILALRDSIQTEIAGLTGDTTAAMAIVTSQLHQAEQNVVALADAFTVAAESMAPPDEVLAKAQAVKDAIVQTLQAEINLVTKLHDEVLKLQTAMTSALTTLADLTNRINALSGTSVNVEAFVQQALQAWQALAGNVPGQIAIFTAAVSVFVAGMQQLVTSGASLDKIQAFYAGGMDLLAKGFEQLLTSIRGMSNPQDAITALQGLAGAVNQWLAGMIQATQAYYARLRQAAQDAAAAEIAALNAQKTALQAQYTAEIDAIKATQTAATDLHTTLNNLASAIKSATAFMDELTLSIAKLTGTYSAIDAFTTLLAGAAEKLAAIHLIVDPQEAITALQALSQAIQQGLQEAITATQARFAELKKAAQDAAQVQIDALNKQKTVIQETFKVQIDALTAQKQHIQEVNKVQLDALNKQLALAQQWGQVLDGVKKLQTDIFNLLAPTHPQTSLDEVLGQFRSTFSQFQGAPTPELGTQIQELARQVLDLAKSTPGYELPSSAFQTLVAEIQRALTAVAGVAGSGPTPEQIQAQIKAIEEQQVAQLKAIDDQIQVLNDAQTAQLKAIDAQIATINEDLQHTLDDLSQQEQAAIEALKAAAVVQLQAIQNELRTRILELQSKEAEAAAQLQAILGDQTYEQFMAATETEIKDLQAQQTAALAAIDAQIAQVNADLQATLTSLSQQEQDTIRNFQDIAARALSEIRDELVRQMTALQVQEADAAARLQAIIGDKTYEEFIATKQAEAVAMLQQVDATLKWYLGTLINNLFPGAGMPTAATGMDYVPQDGPVFVHRKEAILTVPDAEQWRSGKSGGSVGGTSTVNISFTYAGSARRDEWDRFLETVIDDARFGKLGKVISEKVKGA